MAKPKRMTDEQCFRVVELLLRVDETIDEAIAFAVANGNTRDVKQLQSLRERARKARTHFSPIIAPEQTRMIQVETPSANGAAHPVENEIRLPALRL